MRKLLFSIVAVGLLTFAAQAVAAPSIEDHAFQFLGLEANGALIAVDVTLSSKTGDKANVSVARFYRTPRATPAGPADLFLVAYKVDCAGRLASPNLGEFYDADGGFLSSATATQPMSAIKPGSPVEAAAGYTCRGVKLNAAAPSVKGRKAAHDYARQYFAAHPSAP